MIIDLSVPIESGPSEPQEPVVNHLSHTESGDDIAKSFGCAKSDLPEGMGE